MSSAGLSKRRYRSASPQLALVDGLDASEGLGDDADFYRTPAWCTRAILPHLPSARVVLDPCAGDGAILDAFIGDPHVVTRGIEIDRARAERAAASSGHLTASGRHLIQVADALTLPHGWNFDLAIFNPPFVLAEEFVRRALHDRESRSSVAALLRLAFLESKERRPLHAAHPADIYPLAARPQFIDPNVERECPRCVGGEQPREKPCKRCNGKRTVKGGQDSAAYAWFVWGPGRGGRWFAPIGWLP